MAKRCTEKVLLSHHNACARCSSNQTASSLCGRNQKAGHMLILPKNNADEKENGCKACRGECDWLDEHKEKDYKLACSIVKDINCTLAFPVVLVSAQTSTHYQKP